MDKKITEFIQTDEISPNAFFVIANEQEDRNYKINVSDLVKHIQESIYDDTSTLPAAFDAQVEDVTTTDKASASVDYKDGLFSFKFGLQKGAKGDKGERGEKGEKGEQGTPGIGKDGEITRTVFAFKSSLTKPETPTGGSWDFESNSITYPNGWSGSDNLAHPVWMSNATFNKDGIVQDWSEPIQITGDDGVNGTDGVSSEFIFKAFAEEQPNLEAPYSDPRIDDFQTDGWLDHPTGVSEEMQYEYMCIRYKDTTTGLWGPFSKPSLWSKWGADGRDGDGVEYIYQITKTNNQPATPGKNPSSDSPTTNYQESEFIPVSSGEKPWTDNPTGVTEQYAYEWVSVRKYKRNEQMWGDFSEPALWAKYGVDGQDGEDGTSVAILGSYDTYEQLEAAWNEGTLKGNNPPQMGDGYLVNGDLWVFDGDNFYNCGQIKGPQGDPGQDGQDGVSMYVHIKYAEYLDSSGNGVFTEDTGNGIGETPGKYIGVLVNYTESDSTNSADYTWSRFQGNDGFGYEYIFKRSEDFVAPTIPTTITASNIAPDGWTDDPVGVDATNKYEWCCYRKSDEDGNWGPWRGKKEDSTKAWLFAMYAESVGIPGATGNPGPVLYPAGEWTSGTYSQTFNDQEVATATPYVVYNNMHYVLMVPSTTSTPGIGTDWQKMENFSALYTDILLADRATVGNACFYGNYMFSQQGEGNLADFDIYTSNPYEGSGFKPAWCVNLVTGEMWAGTGSSHFAPDGGGYLANEQILWTSGGHPSIVLEGTDYVDGLGYKGATFSMNTISVTSNESKFHAGINMGDGVFCVKTIKTAESGGALGSYAFQINGDGSGSLAHGNIEWDEYGHISNLSVGPYDDTTAENQYAYIDDYQVTVRNTGSGGYVTGFNNVDGFIFKGATGKTATINYGNLQLIYNGGILTSFTAGTDSGSGSSNIQFVSSLPSSPDDNTLYVIV